MHRQFVLIVILVVLGFVLGSIGTWVMMQNKVGDLLTVNPIPQISVVPSPTKYPSNLPTTPLIISPTTTPVSKDAIVRSTIEKFEKALQNKNITEVTAMFTAPSLETEVQAYNGMMGLDGATGPRLFNTGGSNFKIDSWTIVSIDAKDSEEFDIRAVIDEQRRNWSQMTGGYGEPQNMRMVMEMIGDTTKIWVKNYYFYYSDAGGAGGSVKYNGLGF
ncbi:hypothetical protein CO051_06430 [Candidatus Roizmanbacteria bacterium CG_4_9_14_0_2_um_filter_39_13]|uniref:Uncharacterized protein n=1 Tax=Candidatus Roizmanbacteria bacterium CG_4_9_14_0_2_um_filter_39_13 TaxID=1974839 RepID=A0A2M8EWR2_9BACT|nr:MAG: hypothetical protein CO051_06430 [Candidatus Roizmanbacteria bacterium CG_4_9_14_0_2_um_filter_39_13]